MTLFTEQCEKGAPKAVLCDKLYSTIQLEARGLYSAAYRVDVINFYCFAIVLNRNRNMIVTIMNEVLISVFPLVSSLISR